MHIKEEVEISPPLISVVLPVYNCEKYIAEAVESILCQTCRDFEFIIVDDGSTDGTFQILQGYQEKDTRILLISRENRGLVATLNECIDLAQGKYIARMDADDISHPERFEKQVQHMEAIGAHICGCHWFVINEVGKFIEAKLVPLCRNGFVVFLSYTVPFAHGSVLMRTDFIRMHSLKYGEARFAEDYDLWIRFFENGAVFANVNEFLFKYRELDDSLSKRLCKKNASDAQELRKRFIRRNQDACLQAVQELTNSYATLSQTERVFLLIASYVASITLKRPIIFRVARYSSARSIGVALLYWWRGL